VGKPKRKRKRLFTPAVIKKTPFARQAGLERRRQEIEQRHLQQQAASAKQRIREIRNRVVGGVLIIATLLGGVSAILSFQSHVTVAAGESLDPTAAFATKFTVSNSWSLNEYDIEVACGLGEIITGKPNSKPTPNWRSSTFSYDSQLHYVPNDVKKLEPGESVQETDLCAVEGQMAYADIAAVVSFRPAFWPWRRTQRFRFVTETARDGHLTWSEKPFSAR